MLLQSCLTLRPHRWQPTRLSCPRDSPGKNTGVVAISFSNAWKWKVKVKSLSRVGLFATPRTAAYQAPPSMGFSRQEYWSGVPLPSPDLVIAFLEASISLDPHVLISSLSCDNEAAPDGKIYYFPVLTRWITSMLVCLQIWSNFQNSSISDKIHTLSIRFTHLFFYWIWKWMRRVKEWHAQDSSLPCSSAHGILQARILEWVAIPFSKRYSWPRDWT